MAACQPKSTEMAGDQDVSVGSKAPLFTLVGPGGKTFALADHLGKKILVIYFYPKDESYGCTKEACSFRDAYEDFTEAGAEVVGISSDDLASHEEFTSHHKLPFILLSDPDHKVARLYGVSTTFGISGRVTFIIDKEGVIRGRYSSQMNYNKHVAEALKTIKSIQ